MLGWSNPLQNHSRPPPPGASCDDSSPTHPLPRPDSIISKCASTAASRRPCKNSQSLSIGGSKAAAADGVEELAAIVVDVPSADPVLFSIAVLDLLQLCKD